MIDPVILIALPFFALTMLLEAAALWRDNRVATALGQRAPHKGYHLRDSVGSLSMGVGFVALDVFWKIVMVGFFVWLYQFRIFDIQPVWWAWVLLLFADDFCMYWSHRLGHEVRVLWCSHHTHHSSEHYNLSTVLRQSWTEQLQHPLIWGILPLLGFPVEMVLVQMAVNLLYQYTLHTELIGDMGRFGLVFNTPAFHRVHHGRNPQYMDRNYGGIFIFWDRLFGTFEPEGDPVDYGVTVPINSDNPLRIATAEFVAMGRDVGAAQTWRGRLGSVFGRPGWREDGHHQTSRVVRARWEAAQHNAGGPAAPKDTLAAR